MDTNLKNAISAMREDIAEIEKQQRNIKPQRKEVHYKGERTVQAWQAEEIARNNKKLLRCMYAAYNLLRGKGFDKTESNAKPIELDKYYEQHGIWLNYDMAGKHPLFVYLSDIKNVLSQYGYDFKNYEIKKDRWGCEYRAISLENYEEVICIS